MFKGGLKSNCVHLVIGQYHTKINKGVENWEDSKNTGLFFSDIVCCEKTEGQPAVPNWDVREFSPERVVYAPS